jgi:hypothetical protein
VSTVTGAREHIAIAVYNLGQRLGPPMFFTTTRLAALRALACACCLLLPAPAAAEWRRLDTPNFIVIGDAGARELRDIAVKFEGFRETLGRVLSAQATATAVPTVVIVFPNDRAFTPFKRIFEGRPVASTGTFYGSRDINYIAIVNDGRPGALRVIFHEYAHLVVSNVAMNLPAWLNEGLAEYYSTYELSQGGREALIGRPIESHLRLLSGTSLLPLDQLLAVNHSSPLYNEGERRSVFYAQAWALTHLLLLGEPSRADQLAAFIRHRQAGMAETDAWRQAFGDLRMDRELERYARRQSFRALSFKFTDKLATFDAQAVSMPGADVQAFLAGLHVRQRRHDDAERLLAPVMKSDPSHALSNVVMASVDAEKNNHAGAMARLMALGPSGDWFVSYAAGAAFTTLMDGRQRPSDANVVSARSHFDAVRRHREMPNVLAHLAMLDLLSSGKPKAESRVLIEQARRLAPGRDDYALIHARLLAMDEQFAAARQILAPLMAPGYPDHVRETARSWMGNVVRMEENRRAVAQNRRAEPSRAPEPTGTEAARPSAVRPVFRATLIGETRLEGTLERIDCPARAPVTFHVRTAAGIATLHAEKLDAVEFITYRDDLRGSISCGPWKEPAPVYATWRDGPKAGVKTIIAVEFLPR